MENNENILMNENTPNDELSPTEKARAEREAARKRKNRRRRFVAGLIAVTLSLVGAVSIMMSLINFTTGIFERSKKEKFDEYNSFLLAVAAIDPDEFDDITNASMEELVEISVWSIIGSDLDPEKYDYSSGDLAIPTADVEAAFVKYFGTQVTVQHTSVEGYGYEFRYSEEDDVYYIPLTTITPIFTPSVISVKNRGGAVTVVCGLINSTAWIQNADTGDISRPEPDKYIRVTMREYKGKSYISAIQFDSAA